MKILIVADGYFPGKKYGGPPVSVDNFCSLLMEFDCYVVTRNHDLGERDSYEGVHTGWNDRGNCKVRYLSNREYGPAAFEAAIREVQPDWIYLQSLFQRCVLPCLWLAKKHGIRVLLAPRGELCKGAFRKKYKKIPYIAVLHLFDLLKGVSFQSTSDEETEAIGKHLRAEKERIHFLSNVPSIPAREYPCPEKQPGCARLVFLSRIHPKKNLLAAIGYLANVTGNVALDIYGPQEDATYWSQCQAAIDRLPDNVQVRYCGMVGHEEVHRVFGGYDAFLFPTFSENYGHVIVEAMMVGCPVIISDQTPWNDVAEHGAGWAIALDRPADFTRAIDQVAAWEQVPREQVKAYISGRLNLPELREKYRQVFENSR